MIDESVRKEALLAFRESCEKATASDQDLIHLGTLAVQWVPYLLDKLAEAEPMPCGHHRDSLVASNTVPTTLYCKACAALGEALQDFRHKERGAAMAEAAKL